MIDPVIKLKLKIIEQMHKAGIGYCSIEECDDNFTFDDLLSLTVIELLDCYCFFHKDLYL